MKSSLGKSLAGPGKLFIILAALLAQLLPAHAQLPQPSNLQVLSNDLTGQEMMPIMRKIAGGLGVSCIHCHVGENSADLSSFDFASDEKETKLIAREMLLMVQNINGEHIRRAVAQRQVSSEPAEVTCATCHRGQTQPRFIQDIISERFDAEGLAAAIAYYRELREQYFGGYQYDFQAGPLSSLAESLAAQGHIADAIVFAQLAVDYYPEQSNPLFTLAQIQEQAGFIDLAISSLTRALDLSPPNFTSFFANEIRRLQGAL